MNETLRLPGRTTTVPFPVGPLGERSDLKRALRRPSGMVIIDREVLRLHKPAVDQLEELLLESPAPRLSLDAGERTKDAARLVGYWEALSARSLDRGGLIIVIGGGTILDVGAFLAATWLRGVACVVVPTTLLAQVDAGLGGKCGVNLGDAKNQVGVINQPNAVLVDPSLLSTLSTQHWQSGLGEVVKSGLIAGGQLWEQVKSLSGTPPKPKEASAKGLRDLITGCLATKARIVEEDELESGLRQVLNLGHTVAHVVEGLALAQGSELPHGCAVALGMVAESRLFSGDVSTTHQIVDVLRTLGFSDTWPVAYDNDEALTQLRADKKRRGRIYTVPRCVQPGQIILEQVSEEDLLAVTRAALAT